MANTAAANLKEQADAAEHRLRLAVARLKSSQVSAFRKAMKDRKSRGSRRSGRSGGMMALSGGYEAASRTRMSSGRTRLRGGSVDSFLDAQTLDYLRRDGRSLMRNNPIARGMVRRCIDMIAGGRGFTAHAATDDAAWNEQADAWWDEYWHDKRRCDARGMMNGDELVRAAVRQVIIDGDAVVVPQDYGLLQFVDAERIVNPEGRANTDRLINGVEVDNLGMPAKFHIADYRLGGSTLERKTTGIDADQCWFLCRPEWMSQTRGEPRLGAVSDDFDRIRDFIDTTLTAAQTAAMFTGVLQQTDPTQNPFGAPVSAQESDTDGSSQDVLDIEMGSMMRLKTGESFSQMEAKHPNATFESFIVNLVRIVGQDLDLPLEVALLHFGLTVFASAKASLTVCLQSIETWQEWLIHSLLRPWWKWRIAMAILDGELPENRQFTRVTWTPPARPNLDPQGKSTTDAVLVGQAMKTLAAVAAESGQDWRAIIDQRAAELEYMRAKGVPVAPMPGAGPGSGQQTGDSGQGGKQQGGGKDTPADGADAADPIPEDAAASMA